jgi:hypothetical protein
LGVLYQQQGKPEQAVGYFERFFELARSLGEHLLYGSGGPSIIAARGTCGMQRVHRGA